MKKVLIVILVAVVAVALFAGAYSLYGSLSEKYEDSTTTTKADSPNNSAADAATDFTFYDKDDNAVKLSDFFGKPIVINFWASWCGPCQSEMPHFQKAFDAHGEEIQFLMIDLNGGGNDLKSDALKTISQSGYTFPVYFDGNSNGAMTYSVMSMPTTIFIDADGNIVNRQIGMMSETQLNSAISSLLNG